MADVYGCGASLRVIGPARVGADFHHCEEIDGQSRACSSGDPGTDVRPADAASELIDHCGKIADAGGVYRELVLNCRHCSRLGLTLWIIASVIVGPNG
jgi:hypothetical protein